MERGEVWLVDRNHLIERLGALSSGKQHELDVALALTGGDATVTHLPMRC